MAYETYLNNYAEKNFYWRGKKKKKTRLKQLGGSYNGVMMQKNPEKIELSKSPKAIIK